MAWDAIKEARRKLSRELGTIFKDWGGRIPICLIYPNSYYVGMSNLGFQTIYGLLNSYDNVVCERAFANWQGKEGRAQTELGSLSLESQRPLSDFAVLAFSISYELDYFNVVHILKASAIPLLAADREQRHPLIIGGGPCIIANPEPLAPFFDCFVIGEGEAILPRFVEVLTEGIEGQRDNLIEALSQVPGVYVPGRNDITPVCRQWVPDLNHLATTSVVLTPETELGNLYLIEVARGCGWGCRFCLSGYHFRPFRVRSIEQILLQARHGLGSRKRLGLVGAAISDHPQLDELVSGLREIGAEISVSSLRVRPLSRLVLRGLAESVTQTVSLAPEAGSQRLRQFINKGITEDDILKAVEEVAQHSLRQLKLYFMVGLPTETDEDIGEIVRLALASKELLDRQHGGSQLILNVTPFIPKAGTPFQWLPMTRADILDHRLSLLTGLRRKGIAVRTESVAWSVVEGVLARGDSRLGAALAKMSGTSLSAWRRALEDLNLDPDSYVYSEPPVTGTLPWRTVNSGIDPSYLRHELERAQQGTETPPCPPSECHKCGVC